VISYNNDIVLASYFHCKLNGNEVSLLPIDHARAFPLTFDIVDKRIVEGELNFYNKPFYANFRTDNFVDPLKCKVHFGEKKSNELIVYNVLDNCFGHAFLKMLLAVEKSAMLKSDSLLIVPSSLAHFLKRDVFDHIIEIDLNYKAFESCWVLNKLLDPFFTMGYNLQLFPVHTYGTFNKDILFTGLRIPMPLTQESKKRICFYYRNDQPRKWNGAKQSKNIIVLFEELRKFFSENISYTVIGSKDDYLFPSWIEDERVNSFSEINDVKECKLLSESLIVISVTGSHMLMPSLLSTITVHLHPLFKYKNMAEDVVNCIQDNIKLQPYSHLFYYGNSNCSDINPKKLAYMVLVHFQGYTEKTFKQLMEGTNQKEWIDIHFPYFKYTKLNDHRSKINNGNRFLRKVISKFRSLAKF
jgi:hypothetical protein